MSIVNDALKKLAGGGAGNIFVEVEPSRPSRQQPSRKWVIIVSLGITILVILIWTRQFIKEETAEEIIAGQIKEEIPIGEIAAEPAEEAEREAEKEVVEQIVEKEVIETAEPVREPELSLTGIIWGDEQPCAFINNIIVEEGEMIDGAKVIKIDRRKVLLTFQEKEIYLSLGK